MKKIVICFAVLAVSTAAIIAVNANSKIMTITDSDLESLASSECITNPGSNEGRCKQAVGSTGNVCVKTGIFDNCSGTID